MSVLIIEDDEDLAELIKEKIQDCGYETGCVNSAKAALEWLSVKTPAIVLLDYTLFDMNAKQFIAEMQRTGNRMPPFIISTGQGDERIAVDMMKLGARDYIIKDGNFLDMIPEIIKRVSRDIDNETERRRAEDALRKNEEKIHLILNSMAEAIYGIDTEGNCTFCNTSCVRILGYNNPGELLGKNMHWQIHPKHPDGSHFPVEECRIFQVFKNGVGTHIDDEVFWRADGSSFPVEYWSFPQIADGDVVGAVVTFLDITERKLAEEKIKFLLAEKELILKEVHHRIKNNMNTIRSILFLQADTLKDHSAVAALKDAESRVESMMVLYDKLYRSSDFKEMSIRDYFITLIDEIVANFPNKQMVKLEKCIDDFTLDAGILFSLGILINELITNTMKYAFAGRETGTITVSAALRDKTAVIIIQDDGKGIPETVSLGNSSGFGLDLVVMLTEQIGGNIKVQRENGTRFILEFEV